MLFRSRRQGAGRALVAAAVEMVRAQGASRVFLEVRAGNSAALALYACHGFQPIARRRDYYHSPVEDAVVMQLLLN